MTEERIRVWRDEAGYVYVKASDIEAVVLDVMERWIGRVQSYYTEGVGDEVLYGGPSCIAHMGREIVEMLIPSTGTGCPAEHNPDDTFRAAVRELVKGIDIAQCNGLGVFCKDITGRLAKVRELLDAP